MCRGSFKYTRTLHKQAVARGTIQYYLPIYSVRVQECIGGVYSMRDGICKQALGQVVSSSTPSRPPANVKTTAVEGGAMCLEARAAIQNGKGGKEGMQTNGWLPGCLCSYASCVFLFLLLVSLSVPRFVCPPVELQPGQYWTALDSAGQREDRHHGRCVVLSSDGWRGDVYSVLRTM